MVNKIEAKISKIDVLERSYYGNKALHMRIEFEDGSVLETRGHDIGTYRDDNISKLEKQNSKCKKDAKNEIRPF